MNRNPKNDKNPIVKEFSLTVPEKDIRIVIVRNKIIRILYVIGGSISIILAVLGIILPGLPTTPFVLLSAFLYAKSSHKLYNWLLNNKVFGPRIKNYQRRKGITRKGKMSIILFMTIMVLFSTFVVVGAGILRWVIIFLGIIGCITVLYIVPNAKEEVKGEDAPNE